ncbi:FecR domain-containing protein [Bradyrhizobium sp. dw_78]|uniref:FecR family protein n=1 Tax=Bradyrhizobium sp. dw_78 TaxID=2719793 RepID=UPI001BD2BCBB|nr:FecR domain-containing protein [Bradyrhizobium sp. dw_78]
MGPNSDWTGNQDLDDLDPIAREAVAWFALMHADQVANADRASFRAWMRRDPSHRAAYEEVERLWAGVTDLPVAKARRRKSGAQMTRRTLGKAVVALAVGGGAWAISRQFPLADYRTATGERRLITLPDRSTVDLSAASAFSLDFRPDLRLVTLLAGEAFFSAEPDRTRPFVVQAGTGRTMAMGTEFNIDYVSDDDVRVTVAEHAVDVRLGAEDVRIEAGTQVAYGRNSIGAPAAIDPATELAWREGRLVFVSAPFARVVAALNRWRRGRLIVMSPALEARPVTLIVDLQKSGDILSTLETALPIRLVQLTPYLTLVFAV